MGTGVVTPPVGVTTPVPACGVPAGAVILAAVVAVRTSRRATSLVVGGVLVAQRAHPAGGSDSLNEYRSGMFMRLSLPSDHPFGEVAAPAAHHELFTAARLD